MSSPRPVRAVPYLWHGNDGTSDQLCIAITGWNGRRLIIPARQLREVADALHDRADEADIPYTTQENTMTITEEQYDKLMIRAMTEARHAREAEARTEQHAARIGYLEHLLSIREEQLEQLRAVAKVAS
jgi:hypothetical protein